jgi:uncharacterized membrane protein
LALPVNAWAELRLCNKTASNTTVSIAYVEKGAPATTTSQHRGVTVEGWFTFTPGECKQLSDIPVANFWVYYHAYSSQGKWDGAPMLCVPEHPFTASDHFKPAGGTCPTGSRLHGFRRIDTEARTYTLTLR